MNTRNQSHTDRFISSNRTDPDWSLVRPIYQNLSTQFHVLTSAYNVDLTEHQKWMLDHLIIIIDRVDHYIDDLPTRENRDKVCKALLQYLSSGEISLSISRLPFVIEMKLLNDIILEHGIRERFTSALAKIFHYTEEKRHLKNSRDVVKYVIQEGWATSELPLSIMGLETNHKFSIFFRELCGIMGVADLLVDARKDYKTGCISISPSPLLYLRLLSKLMISGIGMLRQFPKPFSFLVYCIKVFWLLLWSKE